jgi:hypothetical protein
MINLFRNNGHYRSVSASYKAPIYVWRAPGSRASSVGIATDYGLDAQGSIPGRDKRFFLYSTAPTLVRIQWVSGVLSPGVKRPRREADHLHPSNAKVKNGGAIPPLPHIFTPWCLINEA